MRKTVHNLLTKNTSDPIYVSSTGAILTFTGPIIHNEDGRSGIIYVSASGFWGTANPAGFTPKLYFSPEGRGWFLHTAFPALTTTNSYSRVLNDLGTEIRLGHLCQVARGANRVRCFLEINEE